VGELALAVVLAASILVASTISVEVGFSVALIELGLGVVVGNATSVSIPDWLAFIGSFAGVVLTFLAGAEVDVPQLRREWKASASIGVVSFFAPFAVRGAARVLRSRLEPSAGRDRRHRALDHEPGSRLRRARGERGSTRRSSERSVRSTR